MLGSEDFNESVLEKVFATPEITAITQRHPQLTVLQPIRPGGQKTVWKVSYQDGLYALKIIRASPASFERAKREINIMRECNSPHLVALGPLELQEIDIGEEKALYYLEAFIDGPALDEAEKPMSLELCKRLGENLGQALQVLWARRYVHRDIKPANIMLRHDTNEFVLLDVGLALDLTASSITDPGGIVGTALYLSPDQIRLSKRQLDFRSDLHATGVCMYECITGLHPLWNSEVPQLDLKDNILNLAPFPLTRHRDDVPDSLNEVVLRLLEKEPNMRYARIEHFLEDLQGVVLS